MATKIVTKNSSTASAVPTASDLVQGELAVNVADKKLFTEDNSGAIIELADGVKLAGIEASADVTDTTNVTAAGALMDSELTSEASVKALNQGVATTDSPAFAGLTVDTTTLAVDSTNNRVGIGTSSPSRTLHLKEAVPAIRLEDTDVSGVYHEIISEANTGYCIRVDEGNVASGSYFRVDIDNSEKMRIDSSGNVGIGTSSPQQLLTIGSHSTVTTAGNLGVRTDSSGHAITILEDGSAGAGTDESWQLGVNSSGDLGFFDSQGTTAKVTFLDNSGNVGIGTSSPSSKLSIHGSAGDAYLSQTNTSNSQRLEIGNAYSLITGGSGSVSAIASDNTLAFATSDTERMRIDSSGNVLVGSTSSNAIGIPSVEVGGSNGNGLITVRRNTTSLASQILFKNPNGYVGQIQTSGLSTSYVTSSDQRLKENIADADDAGSKIDAIQVRQYDWKADGSHQDYGMIAQELLEVAPEAVSVPEDSEEMMGVDYSKLVPMLVKEIQSLRARVNALEAE